MGTLGKNAKVEGLKNFPSTLVTKRKMLNSFIMVKNLKISCVKFYVDDKTRLVKIRRTVNQIILSNLQDIWYST